MKRWPECAGISKQKLRIIHWEKIRGYRVSFWKKEALYAELNETVEAATSSYSATGEFIRHIYYVLVAKNHQKIRSICLVHEFSFTDIFLNSIWLWLLIAFMKRCAEQCALQLYDNLLSIFLLFQLQSWIILSVRTKVLYRHFHAKRVIMEIVMMKIFNNYIWQVK